MVYTEESRKKAIQTAINKIKFNNPGVTDQEALELWHKSLRERAAIGGKNGKTKGFGHGLVDPRTKKRYETG